MRSTVFILLMTLAMISNECFAQRAILQSDRESGCLTLIRSPPSAAEHVVDLDIAISKLLLDAPLSLSQSVDLQKKAMQIVAEKSQFTFDKTMFDKANSLTDFIVRSVQEYARPLPDKKRAASLLVDALQLRMGGKAVDSCFEEPASTTWKVVP